MLDAAGRTVAETRSGADGRFHVALRAGHVHARPAVDAGTPPRRSEQTVIVVAGGFTAVRSPTTAASATPAGPLTAVI